LLSHRHPQQSGFMPGRSTCDCLATLCNIAQWRQDFGHPTFAAFVDLRAAFDSLSRPAFWLLLTRLGILDKIVRLFRVLYNFVSCVRTGGTRSSWFKIEAGVRQGCVLSPDSFATGMDWLLDRTVEYCSIGVAFGQSSFTDLDFADDVSLFAELLELLVPILETIASEAASLGELAEDKGTSFGLQGGYTINYQGSGPSRHGCRGVFLPRLSYPLINRKHL